MIFDRTRVLALPLLVSGLLLGSAPTVARAEPCPAGHRRIDPVSGVTVCEAQKNDGNAAGDVAYLFDDDALAGSGIGANAAKIVVRRPGIRRTLIRPRLNFVPELVKSVEML